MKIKLTFTTPHVYQDAVGELNDEDRDKAESVIDKFVIGDDSITVEFDTETGEAKVLPA